MPCTKCEEGKYKWGETGECEYDSLEACESANHKYSKMKPTPLGKKTYEQYEKELKEFNNSEEYKLSKIYKIKLSKIDDIEEVINQGLGLSGFVEESLDEALKQYIKAKDIVRFDMTDSYTEAEGMLNEFLSDIKELGIDVPAEVKALQKGLNDLDKEIDDAQQKLNSF